MCYLIEDAFSDTFTRNNIKAGFARAGMWPANASRLFSVPRPRGPDHRTETLGSEQLTAFFLQKRAALRDTALETRAALKPRGYVDTTYGEVMTSDNILALVTAAESRRQSIKSTTSVAGKNKALAAAKSRQRLRKHTALVEEYVMARRAALFNMSLHE